MSQPSLQQNSGQKRGRTRRGKRGGKKHKSKQQQQQQQQQQQSNSNGEPISATSWSALEKEWFPTDALSEDNNQTIPEPFLLSDLIQQEKKPPSSTTSSTDACQFQQLQQLWWNFSHQKHQRHPKSTFNDNTTSPDWKPRPIQLQSWSILMQNKKHGGHDKHHQSSINMIGLSPTASGKTLAFGAPMVLSANSVVEKENGSNNNHNSTTIWGIVLVPTRELAQQVAKELELMVSCAPSKSPSNIRVLTCCGGDSQSTQDQIKILQTGGPTPGCRWLISATPGRLWDMIQKCQAQNARIVIHPRYLVLDESDRLASNSDLGEQVTSILKACMAGFPAATLAFFSATYPHKVQDQWREWMNLSQRHTAMIRVDAVSMETSHKPPRKKQKLEEEQQSGNDSTTQSDQQAVNPVEMNDTNNSAGDGKMEKEHNNAEESATSLSAVKNKNDFLSSIPAYLVQTLHVCAEHKKARKLMNTLDKIRKEEKTSNCRQKRLGVVFFGRIKTLIYISNLLKKQSNHSCLELHSQLPQHMRTKNMQLFQTGKVPILLATDIAARGLHVSNIGFVINYDFPSNLEQYVHRCGRAGRNFQSDEASESKQTITLAPTIYSFFTRSLAPMAPDLVSLLQASKAWVDPNLLALVNDLGEGGSDKKKKPKPNSADAEKPSNSNGQLNTAKGSCDDEPVFSDDDAFPELSAKRIVLKRASHVSDASSSSSASDEDD